VWELPHGGVPAAVLHGRMAPALALGVGDGFLWPTYGCLQQPLGWHATTGLGATSSHLPVSSGIIPGDCKLGCNCIGGIPSLSPPRYLEKHYI
jgi:hypothetical protein